MKIIIRLQLGLEGWGLWAREYRHLESPSIGTLTERRKRSIRALRAVQAPAKGASHEQADDDVYEHMSI